jgi:hypothetical protein
MSGVDIPWCGSDCIENEFVQFLKSSIFAGKLKYMIQQAKIN